MWQDLSDRNPNRDPLAVQRSTIVVDARDAGSDSAEHLTRLKTGGVNCSVVDRGGLNGFSDCYRFLDAHKDAIAVATTVREIRELQRQGKIARVFHFQGAQALEQESDWRSALRAYYQLGLRLSAVAINVGGQFGGGCLDPQLGLTRAGRRLVEEIHALRIVLDVGGHTGDQTTSDAIEMSQGVPVICSHTNSRTLMDNPRNISDRLAEAIAKTGGVVGITAFSDFHVRSRKDTSVARLPQVGLERHLDEYDYFRKLVGPDHIGMGVDSIEGRILPGHSLPDGSRRYPEMYGAQPYDYVKGFSTLDELPNVTRGLIRRGWSTAEIHKLLGDNWLRVYEHVWGG